MAKKNRKKLLQKKQRKKPAAKKQMPSPTRITEAEVRELALTCETLVEAKARRKDIAAEMESLLEKSQELKAAWERGRLLRNLKALGGTAVSVSEAARAMGMKGEALRELLDTDREAAEVWNEARLQTLVEVKAAMVESAKEGRPAAIKQIEQLLRQELAVSAQAADLAHVTIKQMEDLTGKTRQTLHEWYTQYGLPRNSDKTYDLAVFIPWYERFCLSKQGATRIQPADPLKAARAEKIEMELSRQKNELLDRQEVLAGFLARYQSWIGALTGRQSELSLVCQNQPAAKIEEILGKFFDEVRRKLCEVPELLHLPEEAGAKLAELLGMLAGAPAEKRETADNAD